MMAADVDAAEVRKVLRDHGHTVPERGKISADNLALYEGYLGGVTPGDFDGGELDPIGDLTGGGGQGDELDDQAPGGFSNSSAQTTDPGPGPGVAPEQTPRDSRQPAAARARALWSGRNRTRRPARKGRARTRREWLPTGPLIERIWSEMAQSASKIPPLQKVLAAQAPMAGIVLQDATRDTIVDRLALQHLARGEDRLEAVNAMLGPPLFTSLIIRFGSFDVEPAIDPKSGQPIFSEGQPVMRPVIDQDGMPAWHDQTRVMIGGLRLGLMSWLRIGQRHASEIMERADALDELGAQADDLIRWILQPGTGRRQSYQDLQHEARERTEAFLNAGRAQDGDRQGDELDDEQAAAQRPPVPVAPTAAGLGWPAPAVPDPRTLQFVPPDPGIASQVVPRAPMPQALPLGT